MSIHSGANRKHWLQLMGRFPGQKVAVLGDLMLDEYIWGTVERISPEAPVPVLNVVRESCVPGGAGNVAANLAALGATPILLGIVGKDRAGELLRDACERRGIRLDGLLEDTDRSTTIKTRLVAHNQQVVRIDREQTTEIGTDLTRALLRALERKLDGLDAVIISDYNKGAVSPLLLREVSRRCQRAAVPLFLDCKSRKFKSRLWITGLTPNEHEVAVLTAIPVGDAASLRRAVGRLLRLLDVRYVLVTRGERGMMLFERTGKAHEMAALAREVYDVTGAGDTVIATFALALASGARARDAMILASAAAAQVVSKIGTATASPEEIIQAILTNRLQLSPPRAPSPSGLARERKGPTAR